MGEEAAGTGSTGAGGGSELIAAGGGGVGSLGVARPPSVITVGVDTAGGIAPGGSTGGGSSAAFGLGGTGASAGRGGSEADSPPFCRGSGSTGAATLPFISAEAEATGGSAGGR